MYGSIKLLIIESVTTYYISCSYAAFSSNALFVIIYAIISSF